MRSVRVLLSSVLCFSLVCFGSSIVCAKDTGVAVLLPYEGLSRAKEPVELLEFLRRGKYRTFVQHAKPTFPIPLLSEGYVPQGLCYSEALKSFLITYYHPDKHQHSAIALVNQSGRVKSLKLERTNHQAYTGHAGGVAAWEGHIWVTSESVARHLRAADLAAAAEGAVVRFDAEFQTGTRGGFAFCAEGKLWVGDSFSPVVSRGYPSEQFDPDSGNTAWCMSYTLDETSNYGISDLRPTAILSLPNYIQGAVSTPSALFLSCSASTRLPSWLLTFSSLRTKLHTPPQREVSFAGETLPLWVYDPRDTKHRHILPPMSEGIAWHENRVQVLFESAALRYRDNAELIVDYVCSIPRRAL